MTLKNGIRESSQSGVYFKCTQDDTLRGHTLSQTASYLLDKNVYYNENYCKCGLNCSLRNVSCSLVLISVCLQKRSRIGNIY